jgi:hypothetical protein
VIETANRLKNRVDVQQRLSHAHEDQIIDRTSDPLRQKELRGNLAAGQIPNETAAPGGAEGTPQRTADLGGDTDGPPPRPPQQHHLDPLPVAQFQEKFPGGIHPGTAIQENLGHGEIETLDQFRPELLRKIAHGLGVKNPALPDPATDLITPVTILSQLLEDLRPLVAVQVERSVPTVIRHILHIPSSGWHTGKACRSGV